MIDRLRLYLKWPRITLELPPSLHGFVRRNRHTIHRNFVGQQTQDRETGQKTGPYSSVRLLFPPTSRNIVRSVALHEQRERTLASAIHGIEMCDVFLLEYLRYFAIRADWNCMSRRQSHWRLSHSFSFRSRLVRQQPAKRFGNEVAQRGSTLYRRDLGTLQQIIRQVKC
jgi:hypothetical protein